MPSRATVWTADRLQLLTDLWVRGYSASQIAVEIGGVTRDAVLGKVHRMRNAESFRGEKAADESLLSVQVKCQSIIKDGNDTRQTPAAPVFHFRAAKKRIESAFPLALAESVEGMVAFRDLVELSTWRSNQCRFIPASNPAPNYMTCGAPTRTGESYCERCKTIVFLRDPRSPRTTIPMRTSNEFKAEGCFA